MQCITKTVNDTYSVYFADSFICIIEETLFEIFNYMIEVCGRKSNACSRERIAMTFDSGFFSTIYDGWEGHFEFIKREHKEVVDEIFVCNFLAHDELTN